MKFILVSLDDDPARLDKYVAERKFAMPVARYYARAGGERVQRSRHADDVLRRSSGTIQYQVTGVEPHGDAVDRVTWYIEQLKAQKAEATED